MPEVDSCAEPSLELHAGKNEPRLKDTGVADGWSFSVARLQAPAFPNSRKSWIVWPYDHG